MKKLGIVTCQRLPTLSMSDQLLLQPLEKLGFNPEPVIWNNKKVDWSSFDYLILRSCWDYYIHIEDYLSWLTQLSTMHVHVWNPLPILKWNSNKKYLKELEYKGVPIIPTVYIEQGEKYFLRDIEDRKRWKHLVIKPAVGADGFGASRITTDLTNSSQKPFDNLLKMGDILVQPFMNEAVIGGEYSFVFIGGNYSHAILKRPVKGDFRPTHISRGGVIKIEPSNTLIRQAARILEKLGSPLLYARVDGIITNGTLLLMELELIEPYLYFEYAPTSAIKFAKTLKCMISSL